MADDVDLAQAHTDAELAAILERRRQTPPKPGRADCAVCGDPISAMRQRMGAQHCVECQEREDFHQRVVGGSR